MTVGDVVLISGVVMAASAIGSMIAAPRIGRLADRLGTWNVIITCLLTTAVIVLPQAFVEHAWQLIALRFVMGISLAGLMPSINATLRHSVPEGVAGAILGYGTSAQMMGQVIGPLAGGFVGGHIGMRAVFLATSATLLCGTAYNWTVSRRVARTTVVASAGAAGED
jgi:MFS family permease